MSDVFEACWVMGKYLRGVKEAEEEMEGGGGATERRDTTFLHFSGAVCALSLTGLSPTQSAGAHRLTHS